jgi:RHS repeat-associated protein
MTVTTTVYDKVGNIWQLIDANMSPVSYAYDDINRRTYVKEGSLAPSTTFFDPVGDVLSVTDPNGNTTTYAYDDAGLMTQMTDPLLKSSTYRYDGDNRLTATTDRNGRTRSMVYDDDGRLRTETWDTSPDVLTYSYDDAGNRISAGNKNGIYNFGYDCTNRLTRVSEPVGLILTYQYDTANRITTVQDSKGGTLTSAYDKANLLTDRQFTSTQGGPALSAHLQWTDREEVSTVTYYQDASESQEVGRTVYDMYDPAQKGQVKHMHHQKSNGSLLADYQYHYDPGQRLDQQTIMDDRGTNTTTYGYDTANRLTSETLNGTRTNYGYDDAGNRNDSGFVPTVANHLQEDQVYTYAYDNEGNLIRRVDKATGESTTYTYDNVNHLLSVASSTGLQVNYKYDALGQRIERSQTGGTGNADELYAYDRGNIIADLDGGGNVLTRRFYLDTVDSLFARITYGATPALTYYLTDRLGTVRSLMDTTGAIVDDLYYDAYGRLTSETSTTLADRYKFTGRELDSDTGLQHNGAREYDPRTQRWTSQDPLGAVRSDHNLYRYVHNMPVNGTDPSGLFWGWAAATIGAGLGVVGYTIGAGAASLWTGENQFSASGFAGAAAGGAVAGLVVGAFTGDVTSAAGLVALGAAAGAAAGGTAGLVGTLTDQTVASVQTGQNQYDVGAVLRNTFTGIVGGAIGGAVTGGILGNFGNGLTSLLAGGLFGGGAGGAVSGGLHAALTGGDIGDILNGALGGAALGGLSGLGTAGVSRFLPPSWYAAATRPPATSRMATNVQGITVAQAAELEGRLMKIPGVKSVRVFGSRTKGTATQTPTQSSDLDVVLIGKVDPRSQAVLKQVRAAQQYARSLGLGRGIRPPYGDALDIHYFENEADFYWSFLNDPDFDPSEGFPWLKRLK